MKTDTKIHTIKIRFVSLFMEKKKSHSTDYNTERQLTVVYNPCHNLNY